VIHYNAAAAAGSKAPSHLGVDMLRFIQLQNLKILLGKPFKKYNPDPRLFILLLLLLFKNY
jgi:hypothetical protein